MSPNLAQAVAWSLGCGAVAFMHRFRSRRAPRILAALDRAGLVAFVSFGAATRVVFHDAAAAKEATKKDKRGTITASSSITFLDSDGDQINFQLNSVGQLSYIVNGTCKIMPVEQMRAVPQHVSQREGPDVRLFLSGKATGPWAGERRTIIPNTISRRGRSDEKRRGADNAIASSYLGINKVAQVPQNAEEVAEAIMSLMDLTK